MGEREDVWKCGKIGTLSIFQVLTPALYTGWCILNSRHRGFFHWCDLGCTALYGGILRSVFVCRKFSTFRFRGYVVKASVECTFDVCRMLYVTKVWKLAGEVE